MFNSQQRVQDGLLIVHQSARQGRVHVTLEGELDLANTETAKASVQEALASRQDVVVDLGKLEFIDSTGISMLVVAMREAEERLSFLPSHHEGVRRVLSLTGLDERMGLSPAAEELVSASPATPEGPEIVQAA